MEQVDLSLVDIKDLLDEIKNRTDCCVIAYTRTVDPGAPIYDYYGNSKTAWFDMIALCEIMKQKIIHDNEIKENE